MEKALLQMNLQLHHVLSDITEVTGMRMIQAIVDSERSPCSLAEHLPDRPLAVPCEAARSVAEGTANSKPKNLVREGGVKQTSPSRFSTRSGPNSIRGSETG